MVKFERDGRVAVITLDRPEKMNAMNMQMYGEISERLSEIDRDESIWVGIITGAGDRAFTAGADLATVHDPAEESLGWSAVRAVRFDLGLEVQKPLIAAVNGYCLAGGLELALVCDIRIASERAQFGTPEVKWNLLHGFGAQLLPSIVGLSNAMKMLLTGEFIDAHEAHRIGLVQEVVAHDQVLRRAHEIAELICQNGPMAVRITKELVMRSRNMSLADGVRYYQALVRPIEGSSDLEEGTRAFAERRQPKFNNR
ncbi:MAG: enoyl-CoA hydratase-related protein [Candidatus Dormibacteraeota bacterium]|nr:enoyl-CoA hydratase-related protein [Candidatus Dormibacteraeota bacterium]